MSPSLIGYTEIKSYTYPIAHAYLEDRTIFLRPSLSYFGMIGTELIQTSKKGKTRYLRKTLDMWCISTIQYSIHDKAQNGSPGDIYRKRHSGA